VSAASSSTSPSLVRAIGRWSLVALVVNSVIGGGIFGVPSVAASLVGKQAVWAWLIGGLANGFVMACFAEVASRFHVAGGAYVFARTALGRFAGIQIGWMSWAVRIFSTAAVASVFIAYLGQFWPQAQQNWARALVLGVILGALALVNIRGATSGTRLSNLATICKLVPLLVLAIVGGVLAMVHGRAGAAAAPPVAHPQWLKAILLMGYAFGGYDTAMMPLGESKDPQRDAPFALLISLITMLALFISIQVVVTYWLGDPAATERPLADAAQRFMGTAGAMVISVGALISTFGHISANVLGAPRLTYALAENRDFPRLFGIVHPRFRTPWVSIVLFAIAVWMAAVLGGFRWNAFVSSAGRLLVYGSVALVLLALRRKGPAPFTMPAGDLVAVIALGICVVLLLQMSKWDFVVIAGTVVIAALNWLLTARRSGYASRT
jgi:APA family basic amino acid/polyamine antiporter